MRKYGKILLVLSILAVNPASLRADGFLGGLKSGLPTSRAAQQRSNQQRAEQVASALKQGRINGYDLGVEVRGDTVKIEGKVRDVTHRTLAERLAKSVPGINRVLNELSYVPQGGIQQTSGRIIDNSVRPATYYESGEAGNGIEQVHFQKPGKRTVKKKPTQSRAFMNRRPVARRSTTQTNQKPDHQVQVVQSTQAAAPPAPPTRPTTPAPAAPKKTAAIEIPAAPMPKPSQEVAKPLALSTMQKKVVPAVQKPSNQEVAQNIGTSLQQVGLAGYDVTIKYDEGRATLLGNVVTASQRQAAEFAASKVDGVKTVDNQLQVQGPIAQTAYGPQGTPTFAPPAAQSVQTVYGPQGMPTGAPVTPAGMSMPPMAMGGAGMQSAAMPTSIGAAGNYSNPNLPEHAWPAYAAYPNSAAIQYPKQYSASAWPYIGPFYPYPQVPLGWREVSLQWDDGYWQLDFKEKQDAWYWLFKPKNWH